MEFLKKFLMAKNVTLHGLPSSSQPCPVKIESKDDDVLGASDLLNICFFLCLLFEYASSRSLPNYMARRSNVAGCPVFARERLSPHNPFFHKNGVCSLSVFQFSWLRANMDGL